jgi:hypothetical protein
MTDAWPLLTGEHCVLRVLDEDDVQHWRADEGSLLFEARQEFDVAQPAPAEIAALAAAGFRHDGPPEPWEVGRTRYRLDLR